MKKLPEKPDGERDELKLNGINARFERATDSEIEQYSSELMNDLDAEFDPSALRELVKSKPEVAEQLWDEWLDFLFNHRYDPIKLFETEEKTKSGITFNEVKHGRHGHSERPILQISDRAHNTITDAAKNVCLQYAISSDKPPAEVVKEIPFDLFPSEVMRLRRYAEKHGMIWVIHRDKLWFSRSPLGKNIQQINGVLYFMYTFNDDSEFVPKYIGISRRDAVQKEGLNWAFANAAADNVLTRWGYGKGQHIGELSCAMWPEYYSWSPKEKYNKWLNELFVKQTTILNKQVYFEMIPWFDNNPMISEENLVILAETLFPDEILNIEYTSGTKKTKLDKQQRELPV